MSIADVVSVTVSSQTANVTQAGFGTALILGPNAAFAERVRSYSTIDGVLADFATTTPEYRQAAAHFAQTPRPPTVKIGRLANKPTQRYTVAVASVQNSRKYAVMVDGVEASFTSDASATNDEIAVGLAAAIDVLSPHTITTSGSAGSLVINIVTTAAGLFTSISVPDAQRSLLSLVMDHADPGVAADLAAIKLENGDFYGVVNAFNSKAMALAIAAWCETNKKFFAASTCDTNNATLADSGDATTSLGGQVQTSAYRYTQVVFHPDPAAFAGSAQLGEIFPYDPGTETWAFKTWAGVSAYTLTETEEANLRDKYVTGYITMKGVNQSFGGRTGSSEWCDVVRYVDELQARIEEGIILLQVTLPKIPYTDAGASLIEGVIRAELSRGVRKGALDGAAGYTVVMPKVADMSALNRAARVYGPATFTARLSGAIHKSTVAGTVTN